MTAETPSLSPRFTVSWAAATWTSAIIAVGSLGTLVVVSSVKDVDTLSVVALALAILAFVIQIIVFVAQTWTSSQQMTHAQSVNAETRALLSELQTQARDTNSVINEQYNKLLDRLLVVTKDVSDADPTEEPEVADIQERLISEIRLAMREAQSPTADISAPRRPAPPSLRSWPPLSTLEALRADGLDDLSVDGRRLLGRFAMDRARSLEAGIPEGLGLDEDTAGLGELVRLGFVKHNGAADQGRAFLKLTPMGRAASRLFTARGPMPTEIANSVPWLEEVRRQLNPA